MCSFPDPQTRGAKAHGRVRLDDGLEAEHAAAEQNREVTKRGGRGRVGERGNHRVMRRERARPPWGVVKDARARARAGGDWRGGGAVRGEAVAKKHCVSLGRSFECKPCETLRPGVGFSFTRARVTFSSSRPVVVATSSSWLRRKTSARGHTRARASRERVRAVVAFAKPEYDRAPRGPAQDGPRGWPGGGPHHPRRRARAREDARGPGGAHRGTTRRGKPAPFLPSNPGRPGAPGPPSVLPRPAPGAHTAHCSRLLSRRSNFPGASA